MASSRKRGLSEAALEKLLYDDEDNLSDVDINFDESDIGSDHESFSSHDSNSIVDENEEKYSDEEVEEDDEDEFYIGKDKTSKWYKISLPSSPTRKHKIIAPSAGCNSSAKHVKSIVEVFELFFDMPVIEIIVQMTNIYIEQRVRPNFAKNSDAKAVTANEIKAILGLLIVGGVMRSSNLHFKDLFTESDLVCDFFYMTMSYQRFLFILRCLRFDNILTRPERIKTDKLTPIRDVFENLNSKFSKFFTPSQYVTIDEQLIGFRGNCSFRQYMPSKINRCGIKLFAMCDAPNFYTQKLEVYVGTQPDGIYKVANTPEEIVMRLVEPIKNSGRNVTVDNWYTSIPLANRLLSENKLTLVGTICKNKKELPTSFLPNKNRPVQSTLFGFNKMTTLLSHVPKKSQAVLLVSTMHNDAKIDPEGEAMKPEILTFYNLTKCGVDATEKLCDTYNVGRRTGRWPLALFFHLINICALNSLVIYNYNSETPIVRREFLKQLGKELVKPYQRDRLEFKQLPRKIRKTLEERLQIPTMQEDAPTVGKRKRCHICARSRNRYSKQICSKCYHNICGEHSKNFCTSCFEEL